MTQRLACLTFIMFTMIGTTCLVPTAYIASGATQKNQTTSTVTGFPSASLRQTLTVPSDGRSVQSQPLQSGTSYTVTISGTYVWGGCDPAHCPNGGPDYIREGDAAFLTDDHFVSFADPFWSSFIYLEINGTKFTSPSFQPNHVYTTEITGDGSPATFVIRDCSYCYPDNSGSLKVEVAKEISHYVALGDSYSSGQGLIDPQGNPDFIPDSNQLGINECHRSPDAYPELLKNNLKPLQFTFAACSGAIMADFFKKFGQVGQWTDDPQLRVVTSDADLITLTLGGNDSNFALVLDLCVNNLPLHPRLDVVCLAAADLFASRGRALLENGGRIIVQPRKDPVPGTTWKFCDDQCVKNSPAANIVTVPNFSGLLEQIHIQAPSATVRVLLYPRLFSDTITDKCIVTKGTGFSVSAKVAQKLNQLTDQLNASIATQVNIAKTNGRDVAPIDPNTPVLKDHRLCATGAPWFNGARLPQEYSFHPNTNGQHYFADLVKDTL